MNEFNRAFSCFFIQIYSTCKTLKNSLDFYQTQYAPYALLPDHRIAHALGGGQDNTLKPLRDIQSVKYAIALRFLFIFLGFTGFNFSPAQVFGQSCDCNTYPGYKCISSGALPDLIQSGELRPYNEASTEPQYIVVQGSIDFRDPNNNDPYYFAPSSQILLLPGASLMIRKEVVFTATNIFGCASPSSGIEVFSMGVLRISESFVANACRGIFLHSNSRAEIISNEFANNRIAIDISGNVQLLGEGIAHNHFDGALYPDCVQLGLYTRAISINDVPQIQIGNQSQTGLANRIEAFHIGIEATNSNVDVYNTTFSNGGENSPAIDLNGTNGVYTATIAGLGHLSSSTPLINNWRTGISAMNYNLTVENAFIKTTTDAISLLNGNMPASLNISDNLIEDYGSSAITVDNTALWSALISENTFRDNNSGYDGEHFGIRWRSTKMTQAADSATIRDNWFYDDPKTSPDPVFVQYQFYGVNLNLSSRVMLRDNRFYQNYNSPVKHQFKGIWLSNAPYNTLMNNGIWGNFGPMTLPDAGSFTYRGIEINESMRNFVSCNHSAALNYGFYFRGPADDHTNFRHNEMPDDLTGLYLYPGTIIGQQNDQENKWPTDLPPNGVAEAHFDGMPGLNLLYKSLFLINAADPGSMFWASPRTPANDWFVYSGGEEGLPYLCLKQEGPPVPNSAANDMLIGGGFEAYKAYPASTWEAGLDAFTTLMEYPGLRPEGSPEDQFYDLHETGNLGKLARAQAAWNRLAQLSAAFESAWVAGKTAADQKLGAIAAQNLLMEAAATEAEREQIANALAALREDIQTLQSANQALCAQYETEVLGRAGQLQSELTAISTTAVWEQNLKTVLGLLVGKRISGNPAWTGAEHATLEAIAGQCRHEGGIGVVLARAVIGDTEYDDEAMCPGANQPRGYAAGNWKIVLSPNPAQGCCRLALNRAVNGALFVRNLQGQIVWEERLSGVSFADLQTANWPSGAYILTVANETGIVYSGKLIITR